MFHFTTQNLILAGVFAHLLFSAAKLVLKTPKQQGQIDQIEAKVDDVLNHVVQYLPGDPPAPNNGGVGSSLPADPPTRTPAPSSTDKSSSAQGGTS